jgi:hypothetical protein
LWRNLGVTFTGAVNAILDKLEAHYNLGDHDDAILGLFATHLRRLLSIFEELGEKEDANLLEGRAITALTDPLDQEEVRRQLVWR